MKIALTTLPAFVNRAALVGPKADPDRGGVSVRRHGNDKISLQILEARGDIEATVSFSG
jgi:hypothetical protein